MKYPNTYVDQDLPDYSFSCIPEYRLRLFASYISNDTDARQI